MFDIGFSELLVIAVVALLVLGPERLPHAVRMTGAIMGKARRMMASVREELEREMELAEMQQRIKEQMEKAGLDDARKALEQTQQSLQDTQSALSRDVLADAKPRPPAPPADSTRIEPPPPPAADPKP